MARICLHAYVGGRVQGVGFRQATREEADRLELDGWVRNLDDGRVEVVWEGEEDRAKALERWLGRGPRHAEVSAVEVEQMPLRGSLASSSVADESSSPSGRLARVRGQATGIPEQGMHELLLQFGVVARELDQALFQFAGFFFQAQLREAFHPMDPVVDVIAFQVVIDQGVSFQELAAQAAADAEAGIGAGTILWVAHRKVYLRDAADVLFGEGLSSRLRRSTP